MSDLQDLIHTNAHNAYEIGVRTERERIIKLIEQRVEMLNNPNTYYITAMNIPVTKESATAVSEAIIYAIKGEQK